MCNNQRCNPLGEYKMRDVSHSVKLNFIMVHSTKTFDFASYEELRDSGMFSTEENCDQYLLDLKILPNKRRCNLCSNIMKIGVCSTTKYREGCSWKCECGNTISLRSGSVLQNKNTLLGVLTERVTQHFTHT